MKKLFAFVLVLSSLSSLQAQDSNAISPFYPKAGDWGVVGNISGLISQIQATTPTDLRNDNLFLVRYKKNDRLTYRLGFAPNIMGVSVQSTDSIGNDLVRFDSTASRSTFSIKPGLEYHLTGTKRLDPYFAAEAEFGLVGGLKVGATRNITDTTGTSLVTRTITEDGGFTFGLKLSAGTNFYISPKLFIGAEYGIGFTSVTTGGDRQEVVQFDPVSGASYSERILSSIRTNDLALIVDPTIRLTVGYFFSLKK